MDRLALALTVAFLVIGVVMAFVWAIVHFGQRAAFNPPSPRSLRRLGMVMAIVGALQLVVFLPINVVRGHGPLILLSSVQGVSLLVGGISMVRQHRPTADD